MHLSYKTRHAIIQVTLIILASIMLTPFAWMVSASLNDNSEALKIPFQWIPKHVRLINYVVIFQRAPLLTFLFNSVKVSVLSVTGLLLFGSMAAYAFSKLHFKGRDKIFLLFISTMMIPSSVIMIPKYVLFQHIGFQDTHSALIFPAIFSPFIIFLIRQHMMSIPEELIEAAKIDGGNHTYIFFRLVLPLSTSVLATAFILSFITSWNDFFNPLVYLSSIKNYTIPLGITTFNSSHSNFRAWTSAASIVALFPVFSLFLFSQRYVLDNIATSGIKG